MQLSLAFADAGYPKVLFIATKDSLAKDALEAAAKEWRIDPSFLEISYSSDYISRSCRLLSIGIVADSQLTVSLLRCIGKELLTDASKREKVGKLIENGSFGSDRILRLDTPTFTDDAGCLDFKSEWVPDGILNICFANPNPSITSTAPGFLKDSNITNVDLLGLQHVTSVGRDFLYGCCSLKTVNLNCLKNVSKIGKTFLFYCKSLEVVDFSSFEKVTCINGFFLFECSSLKTILNISGLRNVRRVDTARMGLPTFLSGCISLAPINASVPGYECLSEELKEQFELFENLKQSKERM